MNLNQIAVFVRVVDSGSFTRAAQYLKQPKSRVSRTIATLEMDLGVALLYRTTRQFSLTEAGRALHERAKPHIYALEGAAEFLKEASREVAGVLRVTTAEDLASALLGPLIAEAGTLYPKMTIELELSNQVVDLVRDGIDVAIRIGPLEDTTLKARSLGSVALILVASPDYLKSAGSLRELSDLEKHPALDFATDGDGKEDRWKLRARDSKKSESVKIRVQCRSNNPKILLDLAEAGQGIALIPEFLCLEGIKNGRLRRVLEKYASVPSPVHFVWPSQKEANPKVRAFVDLGLRRLSRYFS
ncbi:MAG: LysR family transcriptional regulator [Methylotenera sp.]|nr:LysR family transcriptional regulator [Oligoflexia bacterium]